MLVLTCGKANLDCIGPPNLACLGVFRFRAPAPVFFKGLRDRPLPPKNHGTEHEVLVNDGKSIFIHVSITILVSFFIGVGCDENTEAPERQEVYYKGISATDEWCRPIAEADSEDWQPVCSQTGGPFCLLPACPNPAGRDTLDVDGIRMLACRIMVVVSDSCGVNTTINDRPSHVVRAIEGTLIAGVNEVCWDLKDDSGTPVPDGIFRVHISATMADTAYESYGDIQIQR
jgi:hypothetical protein